MEASVPPEGVDVGKWYEEGGREKEEEESVKEIKKKNKVYWNHFCKRMSNSWDG